MNGNAREPAAQRVPAGPDALLAGPSLKAILQGWASGLGRLGGDEGRPEPVRSDLVLHFGSTAAREALTLVDRRAEPPRRYGLAAGADDLPERLAAIRGTGRKAVSLTILVDPALCFVRTLHLPNAVLPRMRSVLAQDLEASTPFRTAGVYADWYVEGEDAAGLRVRHVLMKRARLDPLLAVLARAGLSASSVRVGPSEDRAMPIDLLSGGTRPMPRLLQGLGRGDAVALGLAGLLLLAAFGLLRAHQDATLAALDAATLESRRAGPQRLAPPVQALAAALAAERATRPPLAILWADLARALPDGTYAESLRLGPEGATAILRTPDAEATLRALRSAQGLGAVVNRETDATPGRLTVGLLSRPWVDPSETPMPRLRP